MKNIKFIEILIDVLAKKSFIESKKLYNELKGFYEIIDISKNIWEESLIINLKKKIKIFLNNSEYKNPLKEKNQVPIDFSGIKENNFEFLKLLVEMKPLYEIEEYKGEKFILLSEKETEDYTVFCLFVSRYSCQKTFLLKGYLDEGCDF